MRVDAMYLYNNHESFYVFSVSFMGEGPSLEPKLQVVYEYSRLSTFSTDRWR